MDLGSVEEDFRGCRVLVSADRFGVATRLNEVQTRE